jgi:heat shock protein HslJ
MQAKRILGALAIMGIMTLTACAATDPLKGTAWLLASLNGQPALSNPRITLAFEEGKVAGTDGCNRYSAPYTVKGGKLEISQTMISTLMACAEPIMQQATAYTAALKGAAGYQRDGQSLTLLDAGGKALAVFTAQPTSLSGTWTVTGYNNGKQAVVSVSAGATLSANFGADGKLSGSAGCNAYNATYETADKTVKIGPPASTKKMCAEPAGVMEQETQFLKALTTAATYRIEGDRLELRTAEGALAVSLKQTP